MRAVGYIRVSTDKEEQAQSLENQKNLIISFIKEKGFSFAGFYVDVESGTTSNREELKRLIEDVKKDKFDLVISKELSRLARNGELSHKLKNDFQSHNIHMITLDGAIDTTNNQQDFFGLYSWLYEQESQKTSNRIKSVYKIKYQNGEFVGSIPPYGYELKNKKLYIRDDETVEVVKWIFEKFIGGWGYHKIAKTLTEKGQPTPGQVAEKRNAGLYWHSSTIQKMLQNPHYKGDLVQNRETTISVVNKKRKKVKPEDMVVVENTHKAIINRKDFEKVQNLIISKKSKGRGKIKEQRHLFTNLIICADCGGSLWYRKNIRGYACGKYIRHGKVACTQHSVKEDALKNLILEDIRQVSQKLDSDKVLKKFMTKIEKNKKNSKGKIRKIETEIETLANRKNNLLDYLLDGTITKEIYNDKAEKLTTAISNLEVKKSELENIDPDDFAKKLNIFKTEIEKALRFDDLTNETLSQLVEKVEIEEDGSAILHYRFADPVSF